MAAVADESAAPPADLAAVVAGEAAPGIPVGDEAANPVLSGAAPPAAPTALTAIERAWLAPASELEHRVSSTRRRALEYGAWNLDAAADALMQGDAEGDPLERAQSAVELSPDLPAARMALAGALWLHGDAPMSAVRSVMQAMLAMTRHLEASVWFAGSALYILALALVLGGSLALLVAFAAVASHAAHDLGHLISSHTPVYAGYALLATLLLLPMAWSEGLLGLLLPVLAVSLFYASNRQRVALLLAAASIVAGSFPVIRSAGRLLEAQATDAVARAAYTIAHGFASPIEIARLEAAAPDDPLAARGLAIHARRMGNLGKADALYQQLLESEPDDVALINNAGNVRLALGHMESALDLYRHAIEIESSPIVLFNLSQAYGRAFQVDDLNHALAQAQSEDSELVATLTALQGGGSDSFVVDLPLPSGFMWQRMRESNQGAGIAEEFRARYAPGRLGRDAETLAAALAVVAAFAILIGLRWHGSGSCARCGERMCPRCGEDRSVGAVCEACNDLFQQPEKTDRALRIQRVNALREREQRVDRIATLTSMIVPCAAGVVADRPLASLLGGLFFAFGIVALLGRQGVVPDPLVAGAAGPFAFTALAVVSLVLYFVTIATSLSARGSR
jgi:tetratricopeptide (TPR) repeat protein